MSSKSQSCYRIKSQSLLKHATELRRQLEYEQERRQQQQCREQVLTDICQLIDGVQHLRRTHQLVLQQQEQQTEHQHQLVQQQQQQQQQTEQQQQTQHQRITAVLQALPSYCCAADLMYKATPELVQAALSLSAADISWVLNSTFHEILALHELTTRKHHHAPPAPNTSQAAAGAASQAQAAHMAELQAAVNRFYSLLSVIIVLQPLPVVQAASINHRTQEQQEPGTQHWAEVTRRVQLTPAQAAYLSAAVVEIDNVRHGAWGQLNSMLRTAASPNFLVLTAQHQHQPAHHAADAPDVQAGGGSRVQQGPQRGPPAAANAGKPVEERIVPQLHQLMVYTGLTALLVQDALTVVQRARFIIASYPYLPAPVNMCQLAVSVAGGQQQAEGEGGTGAILTQQPSGSPAVEDTGSSGQHTCAPVGTAPTPSAPFAGMAAGEEAAMWQHLEERRCHWWTRQQQQQVLEQVQMQLQLQEALQQQHQHQHEGRPRRTRAASLRVREAAGDAAGDAAELLAGPAQVPATSSGASGCCACAGALPAAGEH